MSYRLSLKTIKLHWNKQSEQKQHHNYQLQACDKKNKQNMIARFDNSIHDGFIYLPNNIFIMNQGSVICLKIKQLGARVGKEGEDGGNEGDGEIQAKIDDLRIKEGGVKGVIGDIQFMNHAKTYTFCLTFHAIYDINKTYDGCFNGLLRNQGQQERSFLNMSHIEIDEKLINSYSTKNLQKSAKQVVEVTKIPKKSANWSIKNPLMTCCTHTTQDQQEQVAQQQLPQSLSQKVSQKLITPEAKTVMSALPSSSMGASQYKNNTKQTEIFSTQKKNVKYEQYQVKLNGKPFNKEYIVPLFQGSCKSKNLFSCVDVDYDGQEICILEPVYRNKK